MRCCSFQYSPLCHSTAQGNWRIPDHLGKVTGHWRIVLLFLTKLVVLYFAVPLINAAKGISESNTHILTGRFLFLAASFVWLFCCCLVIFLLTFTIFIFGLLLQCNQHYINWNLFSQDLIIWTYTFASSSHSLLSFGSNFIFWLPCFLRLWLCSASASSSKRPNAWGNWANSEGK